MSGKHLLKLFLLYSAAAVVLGCSGYVTCPNGYTRNPISNTCIRLVSTHKNWHDAKAYCEANGESLATFETLESANWFVHHRKTDSEWRTVDSMWFGAKRTNGIWRWTGKTTKPVTAVIWEDSQPDFNAHDDCMGSWRSSGENTGKTHDAPCGHVTAFICELVL